MLANAILYSVGWFDPSNSYHPEDGKFLLIGGSTLTVPFMYAHDYFAYADGGGFQAIAFPYASNSDPYRPGSFTFTVLMPNDGNPESFE